MIPILHFLATFFIERSCFIFSRNWNYVNEIARAEEDLAANEAVVPVQVLKEAGMTGYRNYNFTMGS